MPDDRTPRILAGFRLHTTTTLLFSIFSTGTNFTKPETICISRTTLSSKVFFQSHRLPCSCTIPCLSINPRSKMLAVWICLPNLSGMAAPCGVILAPCK